ncbi:MAG: CtsR family transcriptional regulator [Leuconostoc sp.]|uniref:CtsR family transcriptional regulator n=1 Tax=Solibacillus TaxID=648800 RepID=UPI0019B0BDD1|nr:CtsR family transcriptional regulator [Solibacillus isronensis]MBC9701725.1 CtsR family transcriptional regulator [Leuconostoc sp.]MCM3723578.1 CtsR family transcriptional regulator [Solibacillus isronensis]
MRNISDIIEGYLKEVIELEGQGLIEIKRNELAKQFACAPSQINYVINTRFTTEHGYYVESKRGGGGYIRILRVTIHSKKNLLDEMETQIGNAIAQTNAERIIFRLLDEDIITEREASIMKAALDRVTLQVALPLRDQLRARIMHAMLQTISFEK